ncbi:DegT/DnrJ/EryC1/StrS family aminotransferase [Halarcobacter sp.]|uniref:DegT/DnrJ/EryC1/StrS family aminotransferase n=1 Tax=Halarcobacter sp. TaxID=2321133 RepID=UPI003A9358C9
MIIRARPKYLKDIYFCNLTDNFTIGENEFYFNSGRAALKFYLTYLSKQKSKKISIAMQAFNCSVVLDSALESGCNIELLDIKLDDFSVSFTSVNKILQTKEIDILLLTHYQGIPNNEYKDIIALCNQYNVIVIEDLAQTIGSKINDIEVGTLGDISLYSYAFDKPFTCFNGGKLKFNFEDKDFIAKYQLLDTESDKDSNLDIKTLHFLYKYSSENYFEKEIDNINLIQFLIKIGISKEMIYCILKYKLVHVCFRILFRLKKIIKKDKTTEIIIKKLNDKKILLINKQEENYIYDGSNVLFLLKLCKQYKLKAIMSNSSIRWNRFSVLDEEQNLKQYLLEKKIQVGNFNWPNTLDVIYNNVFNINIFESLKNSNYVSKNILNIPVWSSRIKEVINNDK